MSRLVPRRTLRWTPLAAGLLILAGTLPAQAGGNWIKTIARTGEAQGIAAAPNGDFYVADGPTDTGATAYLSRYTATGGKAWEKSLASGPTFIRGITSDPNGNAYVVLYGIGSTPDGYPYTVQQVKPNGTLGWSQTWHDADASLTGDVVATRSGIVFVAERDTTSGTTTIRRFKASDGEDLEDWTLSGPKAPIDAPVQLLTTAQGTYLLDNSGTLLRLKSNGTIQWKAGVPGDADRGSMGVDGAGLSVAYDADSTDLRVRRFSLTGVKQWDKAVPGAASTLSTATSFNGQTYTAGSPWTNDTVRGQVLIAHLDKNGKVVGKVMIGTPQIDSTAYLLPRGDQMFIAGFQWANHPLLARVKLP